MSSALVEVEQVAPALPAGLNFKWYGNYGGPGYTAGAIGGTDFSVPAVDRLDKSFKHHDLWYHVDRQYANRALVRDLQHIFPSLKPGQVKYASLPAAYFYLQD